MVLYFKINSHLIIIYEYIFLYKSGDFESLSFSLCNCILMIYANPALRRYFENSDKDKYFYVLSKQSCEAKNLNFLQEVHQ